MTLKINYQMKHAVSVFGENMSLKILSRTFPKPVINMYTDASEIG